MQRELLSSGGAAVTPSDTTDLTNVAYGLWIGVGGTLKVDCASTTGATGSTNRTTFATTVPAGWFPFQVLRVYATGTAATGIVAAYE